jgi:hypothetical protein
MARPKSKAVEEETKENIIFTEEVAAPIEEVKVQKSKKEQSKELLNKFIEEETKMVKGKFRNIEVPGGSQRIQIKKYPGVPMFDQVMEDGQTYQIPLYVARHLNGVDVTAKKIHGKIHSCEYPIHGFKWDDGKPMPGCMEDRGIPVPIITPSKWNRRYAFESLEFDVAI